MPDYSCRHEALTALLATIDGTEWPDDLAPCPRPAVFSTWVKRIRDGQEVDIYTRQCEVHDKPYQGTPTHAKSFRLRVPKPDPS